MGLVAALALAGRRRRGGVGASVARRRPVSGVWVQRPGWPLRAAVANLALGTPVTYDGRPLSSERDSLGVSYFRVPRLANLQMRMGYNSAHFLYGPLWRAVLGVAGFHFVNGSFLVVFLGQGCSVDGGWPADQSEPLRPRPFCCYAAGAAGRGPGLT